MWLDFPKGTREINHTTVGALFNTSLQYTKAYIATDPQNTLFTNLYDVPLFLGSVYPSLENKDPITESMSAVSEAFTWKKLDLAVRILQNYVYVRKDYTNVNATVWDARKKIGYLYFGGPMLPNGYFLPETSYPVSDNAP